ncbi:MAG TPA: hypothetical protein VHE55_15235 [Fimbriimonadaceae bacterium]|nr:hypothetical protein [Fimbriimonadaceae bacterium]
MLTSLILILHLSAGGYGIGQAHKPLTPKIWITAVPDDGPGTPLAGTPIEGKVQTDRSDLVVVIYALGGDRFYAQPFANAMLTPIVDNAWSSETHGGTMFAALLVDPKLFTPEPIVDALPRVDGKRVLAIARRTPKAK